MWLGQEWVKKGSRKERREEQSGPGEEAGCDKGKEQGLWGLPGRQLGCSRAQGSVHEMRLERWAVGKARLCRPGEGFDSVSGVLGSH